MLRTACSLLAAVLALLVVGPAGAQAPSEVPCSGAAARDPERPCSNPSLRMKVSPKPQDALLAPNSPCGTSRVRGLLLECTFLSEPSAPTGTVALIGDSHAAHWRAGLEVVAQARGWRGVSLTRAGCPLTRARAGRSESLRDQCAKWNRLVVDWLRRHKEIETVFVSQKAGSRVRATGGRSAYREQLRGYQRAWRGLPAHVKHVVVIRDPPKATDQTAACIERAFAARRAPGTACAMRRDRVLLTDRAVIAAQRLNSERVGVIDLRRFFCGRRSCFPVVGGVLVHKDNNHITSRFATSLGPYLLRELERLEATWTR